MKQLLLDRVAIINGGATGMGRATALLFAEEGCSSVVADINEKEGRQTAADATARGKESIFIKCDLTNLKDIKSCVAQTVKRFGKVDILVGSAGGSLPRGRTGEAPKPGVEFTDEEYYDRMMDLNLKGHVFFCKEVVPYMKKQKYGKIVLISSMGVFSPPGPSVEYHGAKAGILGVVYNLAYELAPSNINVNAVLPGPVRTPFWEPVLSRVPDGKRDQFMQRIGSNTPLGRVGQPEDIANVILFLCSEMSSYVTGQALNVAGGIPLGMYREGSMLTPTRDESSS